MKALNRPGGRTTDLRRAAPAAVIPPGMAAEIYQLGLQAGMRWAERTDAANGDGYWKGYADGMNDGLEVAAGQHATDDAAADTTPQPVPPCTFRAGRPRTRGGAA